MSKGQNLATHEDIMAEGFQIEPVAAIDGCVCVVRIRIYFDVTILDDDRRLPIKRRSIDQIIAQNKEERGNTRSELTRAKLERGWGWKIGGSPYR